MKVLQLTHNYPSETDGTEGIFIHRINCALTEKVDISVIVLKPIFQFPKVREKYKIDGITVYVINYFRPRGRFLNSLDGVFMLSAIHIVKKIVKSVDLVHSHWQTDSGILGNYISKTFKIPHIVSVRGARIFDKSKKSIYGLISNSVFRRAKLIHTHGNNIYAKLIKKYQIPVSKLKWIPNVIFDKTNLESILKVNIQKNVNQSNKTFLFIGLDGKNKGLLDAVKSFTKAKNENHHLNIVTNTKSKFYNRKIKPIIYGKRNITVFSKTLQENIIKLFSTTDVFLFPSYAEGSPNVVLEAMVSGCYIICYNIEGIENLIIHNQNGRLVDQGNVTLLTKEINLFLSDKMTKCTKKYRDYNYKYILDNYNIDSVIREYISMYKGIEE
ncbi:MAG: glycosyltransferase family 4 protein [Candidatus Marinimicrobia bacterium]|nr:glycosyltransferase family 4 protein [Candidatus Neomarinimicrobiota bacterium]MBL7109685.1 glycosyltransferase family 4 protein [Candidatus Neomarinimicrobiota bacterium]